MNSGSPWSEAFIRQLSEKEMRDIFVADQVRVRIAQLVRALREQKDRCWTQAELGRRADKKQNVISRLENPDEAQPSVQTLLEIASAFDLPLWIDIPEWEDWLSKIRDVPGSHTARTSFSADRLIHAAHAAEEPKCLSAAIVHLDDHVRSIRWESIPMGAANDSPAPVANDSFAPAKAVG